MTEVAVTERLRRETSHLHLETVLIRNFRAFREATFELPPTGLVLIVGPNNTGKSALISALDVVKGEQQYDVRHEASDERALIEATFALTEDERVAVFGRTDDTEEWLATSAFKSIAVRFSQFDDSDAMPLTDIFAADIQFGFSALAQVVHDDQGSFRIQTAVLQFQGAPGVSLNLPLADRSSGSGVPQVDQLVPQPIASFLNDWRVRYQHLRALRTGTTRTRPLATTRQIDASGLNLPETLLDLSTDPDSVNWQTIKDVMRTLIPDAGEVFPRPNVNEVSVLFREPGATRPRNIKDLGTGVEQVLLTAVAGLEAPAGSVVAIEEPETNLHPGAQRELLQLLKEWTQDRLFLVTTHSSVFLDAGAESVQVWLAERSDGESTIRRVESNALSKALDALGVRASDILSADRLLVTEGKGDAEAIRAWYPDRLRRLTIVPGMRGGDLAWQMDALDDLFEAANQLETRVVFLRDRDELSDTQIDDLERNDLVHVLSRRELENYFLDSDTISTAIKDRVAELEQAVPVDPVTPARIRQIADELRPQVVFKRVANNLRPLRLLDTDGRRSLASEGPSKERLLEHIRSRLPERDFIEVIAAAWDQEEGELAAEWDKRWIELAPGADILERLYSAAGLNYNKRTDSARLAALMEPPEEINRVIAKLEDDQPTAEIGTGAGRANAT